MMLRITVHDDAEAATFQLEGALVGPWVCEAEACWQQLRAGDRKQILRVDLTGLTGIDSAGKAFLAAVHAAGAQIVASGCLTRAIVAELTNTRNGRSD